jgi:hypothetical protein
VSVSNSNRHIATLAEVTNGEHRSGLKCWRQRLVDPDVKQLMTMVDKAIENGEHVNASLLAERLLSRFNLRIHSSSVQRHVHKRCKCWEPS